MIARDWTPTDAADAADAQADRNWWRSNPYADPGFQGNGPSHCGLCGEPVDGDEIGLTERFEATGRLICDLCGDDMGEEGRDDA